MAKISPIPTPLAYRWHRFVQQQLPAVTFVCIAALTLWMWNRQANLGNAVGTVEAIRVDVPAGADGLVQMPPPRDTWNRFDTVQADETVAVIGHFDDSLSHAKLQTIRMQVEEVGANMVAEAARFDIDLIIDVEGNEIDRGRRGDNIDWQIEALRLQILDQQTELAAAVKEYQKLSLTASYLVNAYKTGGSVSEQQVRENGLERDRVKTLIEKGRRSLEERKSLLRIENTRRDLKRDSETGHDAELREASRKILAPFKNQVEVLNAQMGEVQTEFNSLEVKAPISGEVTMIHAYPGQAVQAGDPIITIAQDSGRYIVSYVRSDQRVRVEPNMEVRVREKRSGARPLRAMIVDVGPQVEPVPEQHLRDPAQPEWGLPITIELPLDLDVRPGELIDIIFSGRMARKN